MTESDNSKPSSDDQAELPALTSEKLQELVFDTILNNGELFLRHGDSDSRSSANRFVETMDVMNELVNRVAKMAIANRIHLSELPVYANTISADPNEDSSADQHEIRYRIIEKFGNSQTGADQVLSFQEAKQEYGIDFIQRYWGELGEHCPRVVQASKDRSMWFSVVRYPVASLDSKNDLASSDHSVNSKTSDALLNEISSTLAPR